MKNAKATYEYYRNRLLKEAKREGLTAQEEKLLKIVEEKPKNLSDKELSKKASKVKAEFKRIRKTKKYKEERTARNQFYKLKNKYYNEEIKREARLRLMNLPPAPDQLRDAYFKDLSFKKLKEQGITRHVGNKVVKFTGLEAVKTQIKSLYEASNPERKKQLFINTYKENLLENGIPEDLADKMEEYLQTLAPEVITFALDVGYIKSIQFYYIITESDIEAFRKYVDSYTSEEKTKDLMTRFEANEGLLNEQVKIIYKERRLKEKKRLKELREKKPIRNF